MATDALNDWLEKIQRFHSSEIELGLSRLERVAQTMGIKPNAFVITVAGTNGKGSTISALSKICSAHQLKTGVYSSPHFLRFNERICINQKEVSDEALIAAFETIETARGDIPLTFFEYTTLAAFLLFKQADLDVWILEVGLGGRLDAVNIIDPDIAVVTSIGLDHQDYLGDTRELIGFEKAGIFRAGKPAVVGDIDCPKSIREHAENIGAKGLFRFDDFDLKPDSKRAYQWVGKSLNGEQVLVDIDVSPQMIVHNAATVLQTLYAWRDDWDRDVIAETLKSFSMTGRNQRIDYKNRQFIVDVAHNSHAAKAFINNLSEQSEPYSIILGMLNDKDYQNVIQLLQPLAFDWRVVDLPTERNLGSEALASCIRQVDYAASVTEFESVSEAIDDVLNDNADRMVLILGSFYTVAEALGVLIDSECI